MKGEWNLLHHNKSVKQGHGETGIEFKFGNVIDISIYLKKKCIFFLNRNNLDFSGQFSGQIIFA
jgi:hypothetical protein